MNKSVDLLNELIEVASDGEHFYLDAATKVRSNLIREIFCEMADVRRDLVTDLSRHVASRGDRSADATLPEVARATYVDVLARLGNERDLAYIDRLEDVEDRLLQLYRNALKAPPSTTLQAILERHLVAVLAAHNKMRTLKEIRKAA